MVSLIQPIKVAQVLPLQCRRQRWRQNKVQGTRVCQCVMNKQMVAVGGAANVNYEYLKLWIGFGSTKFSRVFRANAPVCARSHQVGPSWHTLCVYVNSDMQIYVAECEAICGTRTAHNTFPTNQPTSIHASDVEKLQFHCLAVVEKNEEIHT